MTSRLAALCIDANDPGKLAAFWAGVLGRELSEGPVLAPSTPVQFTIRFLATEAVKTGPNQMHFDLMSATPQAQQERVERALALGGRHLDIGQGPDVDHTVLADPEGNEFCVIPAGNSFLSDTDVIGCLSSDGNRAVGLFWSEALGWPLVWDQDEETAIQSSQGGSKISWGGPPFEPKHGKNRWHLDLAPVDTDQAAEVDRLLALGAQSVDIGQGEPSWVVMVDPSGNEFCVLASE